MDGVTFLKLVGMLTLVSLLLFFFNKNVSIKKIYNLPHPPPYTHIFINKNHTIFNTIFFYS